MHSKSEDLYAKLHLKIQFVAPATSLHKIAWKSARYFLHHPANRQTDRAGRHITSLAEVNKLRSVKKERKDKEKERERELPPVTVRVDL